MEVIICSKNQELWNKLNTLTDKMLCRKRIRNMSLFTRVPRNLEDLLNCLRTDKGYLIILDIQSYPKWKEMIGSVMEKTKVVKFCIISDTAEEAVEIINDTLNVCGYVIKEYIKELYKDLLEKFCARIKNICGGIMVKTGNYEWKVVPYDDIYYIETMKETHLCNIVHKRGTDIIRADICRLIIEMDSRFAITKSSTIANLALATGIERENLIFPNHISCSVVVKRISGLKKQMCQQTVF